VGEAAVKFTVLDPAAIHEPARTRTAYQSGRSIVARNKAPKSFISG
jgi:putative NADH-flavin reductase